MEVQDVPEWFRLENGRIPQTLEELAGLWKFGMCTVDLWLDGIQLRTRHVRLSIEDGKLLCSTSYKVRRWIASGQWVGEHHYKSFDGYLLPGMDCKLLHLKSDKWAFTTVREDRVERRLVRAVFYQQDYGLANYHSQVVGWSASDLPQVGILKEK